MTIQNTTLRKAGPSQGNGVTTVFPFTFKVFTATDILVTYLNASSVESVLVLSTNYTVTLNADQNTSPGGSVTLLVAPVTATYITLTSQVTNTQTLALTNSGGFYPESINNALDRTVIEIQQLAEQASRAIKFPVSDITSNPNLPSKADRLGSLLAFDAITGNPTKGPRITYVDTVTSNIPTIDAVGANISSVTSVASDLTNINTAASNLTNINTVATAVSNVNAVGNNISSVNSAATNMAAIIAAPSNAAAASSSASTASAARDAALIQAGVYTTEALGRAAVADGVAFKVQGTGDVAAYEYRRTNITTSVLIATYPSSSAVVTLQQQVLPTTIGAAAVTTATSVGNTNVYYWSQTVAAYDQYLTDFSIASSTTNIISVVVCSISGGNYTQTDLYKFTGSIGVNTFTKLNITIPAGCIVGVQLIGAYYDSVGGVGVMYTTINPSNTTAVSGGTLSLKHNFTLVGAAAGKGVLAFNSLPVIGGETLHGWSSITTTALAANYSYAWFCGKQTSAASTVSQITMGCKVSGEITVVVAVAGTTGTLTIVSTKTCVVAIGVNTLYLGIAAPAGAYLGIFSSSAILCYSLTGGASAAAAIYTLGIPTTNTAYTAVDGNYRFELQFITATGILKRTDERINLTINSTPTTSGINALALADNTGVVDCTGVLATAIGSYPSPYVPVGTFSATAINYFGRNFYGDGKLYINGVRFFIPKEPQTTSLLKKLQNSLATNIVNKDVLTLIGDSISHWAYATTADKHFFNLLTRYVNFGAAFDEPIMTAFKNVSTYTPAFYGVAFTGTTPTYGTAGTLNESVILQVGTVLTFTGTYEQIDVFYTQTSSSGTLTFAFNGTPFKTVNASGTTTLDKYSGTSLTSQTGSGTYTITCSVAAVEITGLIRLGVLTANKNRLNTNRSSHGSYLFSSFGAPAVTSIAAQGAYAGGKCVPILALGTNDILNIASITESGMLANAQTLITRLVSAGVTKIYAIIPSVSSATIPSAEHNILALRKLYYANNVQVIDTDTIDWLGQGYLSDAYVHPNDGGNDIYAQLIIESLAGI